jgi:hypothetical protein
VILFRCFPWDREVAVTARGGAIWFAQMLQGAGRHDNPLLYGSLYASESEVSTVVEQVARFTGRPLTPDKLRRFGLPLAIADFELSGGDALIDLDQPRVLVAERLRPSLVATRERARTQADAAALYESHEDAVGIRWWSTFESQWANVTLFDRAAPGLSIGEVRPLTVRDDAVEEAATFLGLRIAT